MAEKSIFNLTCSEAETACDKAQYREMNSLKKLQLKIHLFFCKACQQYSRKNSHLTSLLKKANLKACSETEKENFRRKIRDHSEGS